MVDAYSSGEINPSQSPLPVRRASLERVLFVATIFLGSVLLFLVQPMMARMALPRLGGAPGVWNSAMLVYQTLLLAGYAYAHALSSLPVRRQAIIHIAVLAGASLTLPLALADIAPSAQGWEVAWVPLLFLASIGPVFFAVSAQAPLMQSWYAAGQNSSDPYWLYAASNLGSFGGLLAYPLLLEPQFSLQNQSMVWSAGYVLLAALVALAAFARWSTTDGAVNGPRESDKPKEQIGARRVMFWLALSAVPSGLMLSTTTLLTTDMVSMPLLWVLPLGLYLLSFAFAFNENNFVSRAIGRISPIVLLLGGALAMGSRASGTMIGAIASIILLFVVAIALHRRLYDDRPAPQQLTRFYLMMSLGGALGGLFTALFAPLVFDWVWEHAILVLAAAALLPGQRWMHWLERTSVSEKNRRTALFIVLLIVVLLSFSSFRSLANGSNLFAGILILGATAVAALLFELRIAFVAALLALMLGHGGIVTLAGSFYDTRERSFFGIYEVKTDGAKGIRKMTHGTTLHGVQFTNPEKELQPTAYYGLSSGIGLALTHSAQLVGPEARIGVVGLGVATLACYRQPGQSYEFFEIDPAVLRYSRDGTFTFLNKCAANAPVHIGDARLVLEGFEPARYDLLVIDAFSSDAIPLHLLTTEAFAIYKRQLEEDGVLMIHISNRFIDLAPMISALAKANDLSAMVRHDDRDQERETKASTWVVLAANPQQIERLMHLSGNKKDEEATWEALPRPSDQVWNDDFASILPFLRWETLVALRK